MFSTLSNPVLSDLESRKGGLLNGSSPEMTQCTVSQCKGTCPLSSPSHSNCCLIESSVSAVTQSRLQGGTLSSKHYFHPLPPVPFRHLSLVSLLLLLSLSSTSASLRPSPHRTEPHSSGHTVLTPWSNSSIVSSTSSASSSIHDLVSKSAASDAHFGRHHPRPHLHYRRWVPSSPVDLSPEGHHRRPPVSSSTAVSSHSSSLLKSPPPRRPIRRRQSGGYPPPPPGMYYPDHPMMAPLPPLQILPIENVTTAIGRNAVLKCVINRPGQYKVAWLKVDDKSELTLLTLGLNALVTEDEGKYKVTHNERQWLLHVNRVHVQDRGRYMCQINAKTMTSQIGYLDVFEPPVINEELTSSDTTVDELQKVSLRCAATGYPTPSISWRRESGKSLNLGVFGGKKHAAKTLDSEFLNISQVTRDDMGPYLCVVSNKVPPSVSKRIVLQVNFRPKIRVQSQLVSSYLGSDVELECRVEASPRPVTVWLSGTGQKLEEVMDALEGQGGGNASNEVLDYHLSPLGRPYGNQRLQSNGYPGSKRKKYTFEEENDGYQTIMRLTIRRLDLMDFGSYKCVAKNSIGEKEGLVRLYETPVPTLPPTTTTTTTTTARTPPTTAKVLRGPNLSKTDKWTKANNGDSSGQGRDSPYEAHSTNFGGRSLRENQKKPLDETVDEDEDAFDYDKIVDLSKYKKKLRKNGTPGAISYGAFSPTLLTTLLLSLWMALRLSR